MKRILTALTALVAAAVLTTAAHAGHSMHHSNPHPNTQPITNAFVTHSNKLVGNKFIAGNNDKGLQSHVHRDRLRPQDCGDFRYCCWLPHCHCYCFWCPSDDCWFYWYAAGDCYLPYSQIQSCPPEANVIPKIPGGLPPVVPHGDAGPSDDAPPMPPPDGGMGAP